MLEFRIGRRDVERGIKNDPQEQKTIGIKKDVFNGFPFAFGIYTLPFLDLRAGIGPIRCKRLTQRPVIVKAKATGHHHVEFFTIRVEGDDAQLAVRLISGLFRENEED